MSKARAKKIKLVLFDVDGVLTDGKIWLFPAPAGAQQGTQACATEKADAGGYAIVSQNMVEAKGFSAHDGTGISLARLGGLRTGLITKRISETVALRARDLRVDHVLQGIADKRTAFQQILQEEGLKADAHLVTDHAGGDGALRDAVEYILRAQNKLDEVVERYLEARGPIKKDA